MSRSVAAAGVVLAPVLVEVPASRAQLLISEVMPNPNHVSCSIDACEWVEIHNAGGSPVSLDNYFLGDADDGDAEQMSQFPTGYSIPADGFVVVARQALAFAATYGTVPDFEWESTDPTVPDMVDPGCWGSGSLNLGNAGDEVYLLQDADGDLCGGSGSTFVDVVTWGSGSSIYDAMPHFAPGANESLQRQPIDFDSDDSSFDLVRRASPSLGTPSIDYVLADAGSTSLEVVFTNPVSGGTSGSPASLAASDFIYSGGSISSVSGGTTQMRQTMSVSAAPAINADTISGVTLSVFDANGVAMGAEASTVRQVVSADSAPVTVPPSSDAIAGMAFKIAGFGAAPRFHAVRVTIDNGSGISASDFLTGSTDSSTSGIGIYAEDGTTSGFQVGEDVPVFLVAPTIAVGSAVDVVLDDATNDALDTAWTSEANFYLTFRTSATVADGDAFTMTISRLVVQASGDYFKVEPTGASTSSTVTISVPDTTDPVVTIDQPNGGEILAGGSSYDILWTTVEDNPDVVEIRYSTDSGSTYPFQIVASTTDDGAYTWSPVDALDLSTTRVQVIATDQSANSGSDASDGDFTIDSTAPVSQVTHAPQVASSSPVTVEWTASDGGSGVSTTALWYRFEAGGWTASGSSSPGTSGAFSFDPTSGEGRYDFQTVSQDLAGNVELGPSGAGDDSTIYDPTSTLTVFVDDFESGGTSAWSGSVP